MMHYNPRKLTPLLLVVFLFATTLQSQTNPGNKLIISGRVSHDELPLSPVNIINKNTGVGTKTDANGNYSLEVQKHDEVQFSHLGYVTIRIRIKGDKKTINIEMIPSVDVLDEVIVNQTKSKPPDLREADKKFATSKENVNPRTAGYRISYIKGDAISSYASLTSALLSRFPSYSVKSRGAGVQLGFIRNQPVLWDVDGRVTEVEPDLNMEDIIDIRVLGPAAAVNYGKRCHGLEGVGTIRSCGGVIVIRLKKTYEDRTSLADKRRFNELLNNIRNKRQIEKYNTLYSETLYNINDEAKAHTFCDKVLARKRNTYHKDLQLINNFFQEYPNIDLLKNLSSKYAKKYHQSVDALRALAYELQLLEMKNESIEIYKKIFKLNSKDAKAYRDLANAFKENKEYKNAINLYINYLRASRDFSKNSIDNIIYNELEYLYHTRIEDFLSNYKFIPANASKEKFGKDVRIVLEWNNSEVSFDITFENKENGPMVYKRDHSQLSEDENYSIEEFLIPDIGNEDWKIVMTYFGDKTKTTYFKLTSYYNWGREDQYQETKTYLLNAEFEKVELLDLNRAAFIRQ